MGDVMKRRSRAGGKASKARGREASKTKRRDASKTASSSAPVHDAEVARLTRELNEAREQQTATSEVLEVISGSPGDLQPVFAAMLENAVRICDAKFGNIYRWGGEALHLVAAHNTPPAFVEARRSTPFFSPGPKSVVGRMVATKTVIHVADLAAEQAYIKDRIPSAVAAVELGSVRTILAVPMLNKNELIGSFTVYRQQVRPFTDKQIDLVQNFAAQGVIAIENARLLNELRQSLEQQTATSEVLQVISSSPGDLEPVFQAMLENAVRICHAKFGIIYRWDSDALHLVASHNVPPAFADARRRSPRRPRPEAPTGRMIANKTVVHTANLAAEQTYIERDPDTVTSVEVGGVRSLLSVPMLKENELIGGFTLSRQEVRPFTDKQIELVKNFAAQAVIAIENARLLNELRQRTADLTEALEQQTATSEVLQAISSSFGDLEPVLATMLENAVRICDAKFGNIYRWDGEVLHLLASHNTPPAFAEARKRSPLRPPPETPVGRMLAHKAAFHSADMAAHPGYIDRSDPGSIAAVELGGVRTILAIPMLKENELIGSFSVYRQEVRPFTDKQIALVTSFASQAVIAIENARLLNELRQSLEQQTATSQVLQVISSSPGDLQHVFATMLENATRICEAKFGALYLSEGDGFRATAMHNAPPAYLEARAGVLHPPPSTSLWRAANTKQAVQIADVRSERGYVERDPFVVSAVALGGYRSVLSVPMLHEDELVGIITIFRQEVRPFTDEQISLVQNFAAQAVIAIENARLLNELRQRTNDLTEALEQQTATSEVLQVISSSPGELEPVFAAMLGSATGICEAKFGNLFLREGETFRAVAWHGEPEYVENWRREPLTIKTDVPDIPLARVVETKQRVHVADLRQDVAYKAGFAPLVTLVDRGGASNPSHRAYAERGHFDWCNRPLSPGSSSFHWQADRTCGEFRCPGSDCYREHAPARRTARTNRGRRQTQPTTRTARHRPS